MFKFEKAVTKILPDNVKKYHTKDNIVIFEFPEGQTINFYEGRETLIAAAVDCKGEVFYQLLKSGRTYNFIDLENKRTISAISDLEEAVIDFAMYLGTIIE